MSSTNPETSSVSIVGDSEQERHRKILQALTGLLLGMFVSMIANTVVSTSLPVIVHDLGGDQSTYTWVVTSMMLATAIATPVWGKLADLFSRKLLFQISIVLFVASAAAAGFSQDPTWMITCRVFQGLSGGGMIALSQVIMADIISPRERGRYMGLFGAVMAVATVGGPLLGGVITDTLGWRWNFFVAVPFSLAALIMVQKNLKLEHLPRRRARIDVLGILFMAASTTLLLLWVTSAGKDFEWASATTAWMVGGALVFAVLFVLVEARVSEPLIPLRLFRDRTFNLAVVASLAAGLAMFGSSVYLSQYMQLARGATPSQAGFMTLPLMGAFLISSTLAGRLITQHGRWKPFVVSGAALLTVGLALLGTLRYDTNFALVCVHMALVGLGMGLTMQNLVLVVQNTTAPQNMGVATSGVTFFRTLGGSAGVAGMGAAVASTVTNGIQDRMADVQAALMAMGPDGAKWAADMKSGTLPAVAEMPDALRVIFEDVYAQAISHAFLWAVPLAVLSLIAVLFLPNVALGRLNVQEQRARQAAQQEASAAAVGPATGSLPAVHVGGTPQDGAMRTETAGQDGTRQDGTRPSPAEEERR
jgi:EmrB/QacA subfamily drug resistance transporter